MPHSTCVNRWRSALARQYTRSSVGMTAYAAIQKKIFRKKQNERTPSGGLSPDSSDRKKNQIHLQLPQVGIEYN